MKALATLPLLLLPACSGGSSASESESQLPAVSFDAQRAWEDLRYQVEEIGPRRIGTPQSEETRAYIRERLAGYGWTFEEATFTCNPPPGANRAASEEIHGANLLARRAGTEPGEIWLTSHYDTYGLPGFVGANDGGSSTAVLMELARQLGGDGPRKGMSLVLCWFDGEEPFYPMPWDDQRNSTFGSRHQVELLKEKGELDRIKALVLIDLVGDEQLNLIIERDSTPWLSDIFRRTALQLDENWVWASIQEIRDDHKPFLRAGVPAIDLIDMYYGPNNDYWHDKRDTLEHCSVESLDTVGRLLLSALPRIESRARREEAGPK